MAVRPPTSAQPPAGLPDLNALELLVAVGECGSLSRAAASFGISQPSASERMRTLERRLGLELLHRSTTGSRLTPAGLVVIDWARDVLTPAHAFAEGVAALKAEQDVRLRVAASLTLAEQLVPGWLLSLREVHPEIHVGLQVANSDQVLRAVREADADLGFIEGPSVPRDMRATTVGQDRLVVVVVPGHPWTRRRTPVTGAELATTPLLLREPGSGTRETLERALRPYGGTCEPVLELGATTPLRSAAASGAAPAVLSELAVREDLADGRLVEIPVEDGLPLHRTLRAVWPAGSDPAAPARWLLEVARARAGAAVRPARGGGGS
jgi:DNA-binding transcriptional LysR family regulator